MDKEKLYKQIVMDHYANHKHRGQLDLFTFTTDKVSPSCGDRIIFDVLCSENRVQAIKFRGEGSILGQAVASLLCDYAVSHSIPEVLALTKEDVLAFLGIELGPTRLRTITFIVDTLQAGLREYAQSNKISEGTAHFN